MILIVAIGVWLSYLWDCAEDERARERHALAFASDPASEPLVAVESLMAAEPLRAGWSRGAVFQDVVASELPGACDVARQAGVACFLAVPEDRR
jgi:hypothetical protein